MTGARVIKAGHQGKLPHTSPPFHPFHPALCFSAASSTNTDTGDTTTDTDDDHATLRGRSTSHSRPRRYNAPVKPSATDAAKTRRGSVSSTSGSSGRHPLQPMRVSFTRSKSPLPLPRDVNGNDAPPPFRRLHQYHPASSKGRATGIFSHQHSISVSDSHFQKRSADSTLIRVKLARLHSCSDLWSLLPNAYPSIILKYGRQ
jgi:hypothetical protein